MIIFIQRNQSVNKYNNYPPFNMGIKDLNPYLRENVPECIKELNLDELKGRKAAIDTSIYFYKFLYKNERYLEGFFQQIFRLLKNGITPIYIFDGAPPPEKMKTLDSRKEKKQETKTNIQDLIKKKEMETDAIKIKELDDEITKMNRRLIYVTPEYNTHLKTMLDLMNIQYIQSPGEADLICGKLSKCGKIDLVMSDDMDLLTSGARKVLRNFFITSNKVHHYDLDIILEKMCLTNDQWVDFCVLCGCDYCDRIPNLGPKNAIKLLKAHGSVENILKNVGSKYKVPENYMENYNKSIAIFKNEEEFEFECADAIKRPCEEKIAELLTLLNTHTNLTEKQIMTRINGIYQKL